jgi:hypothetical protein
MGLKFLEHVLILTHDPEGTRDWFCYNLGFRNGLAGRLVYRCAAHRQGTGPRRQVPNQ